ncbi:type I polyketide synthase [Labedaea rhizosphaerae]|uniref:Enediyne polyketide synthase n=1 Tax=Labedaea rhizosphaerae TaxID=598644 RepID=A0A4V6PVV1_LABRH|nr:type I polyketide synthase [Labedaea rhizosphaerae]TDQ00321.1 enediyne polyketide synthase [Labedaea rhizosphaerae]
MNEAARIAIVGMACRYPDANSPRQLWENALAGRRAFRRMPDERLRLDDYWHADPTVPDRVYSRNAAVLEGYAFDRVGHKIAGSTYRATDLTHWLALDVAGQALADAGFPSAEGLPRDRTGVVIGNTLTGEFSRSTLMRLRWPYVRRVVATALAEEGWDDARIGQFLKELEKGYKKPFPVVDEDSLAGGLSNTIAGRICNYFDFHGGGYTVDGACSSSLLAVTTIAESLLRHDIDVGLAGGVDLSLDPFELVGFAKTGALARSEMRVYDRRSNGFWPGEGCGMVVLMRAQDALAGQHRVYAELAGWGISSDGQGGITRPEVSGYRLALRKAYERAGFGIDTVGYFEGHGTGTEVGDRTELTALSDARIAAAEHGPVAAIGSVKGMIGHTKAAAGVAGLIKATMAVHDRVLPPTVGCEDPHPLFAEKKVLRALRSAEPWPGEVPVRAGVTSMGFGGINTHVVVEGTPASRRTLPLPAPAQDAELLVADAASPAELAERLTSLAEFTAQLAYAELGDLSGQLIRELTGGPYRAAVVVSSPEEAVRRLTAAAEALSRDETSFTADDRVFLGHARGPARIGFLFPGQGSGSGITGGALSRRFAKAREVFDALDLPEQLDSVDTVDTVDTAVAQPRIVAGSLAGLRVLAALGIDAVVAVGHSLGELTALAWSGAMDETTVLDVVSDRGRIMAELANAGTMASVNAPPEVVTPLIGDQAVVISGYNSPQHTVVAGAATAVAAVGRDAVAAGLRWTPLAVSHAFHSPLVAPAAAPFAEQLARRRFGKVARRVVSTVTGEALPPDTELRALLHRQITEPVLFAPAVAVAAKDVDLFLEVGPGQVLSYLAKAGTGVPAIALDTDSESLSGLLAAAGAAFVAGAPVVFDELLRGRLLRPLRIGAELKFLANPCESAPVRVAAAVEEATRAEDTASAADAASGLLDGPSTIEALRHLFVERTELPSAAVSDDSHLLDDLHLSSITVGQVVTQVGQQLGLPPLQEPINFATATLREVADALTTLAKTAQSSDKAVTDTVAGAAPWVRAFVVHAESAAAPVRVPAEPNGAWEVFAAQGEAFARELGAALEHAEVGPGVLAYLRPGCTEDELEHALDAAKAVTTRDPATKFVLVHHDRGAAGLAKTLRLEDPLRSVTIVRLPVDGFDPARAVEDVVAEVAATIGFAEVWYDDGTRRIPTLRATPVRPARRRAPIGAGDVVLVTGGGKGITAECALAVAETTGAALAILGRTSPADDLDLAANLKRIAARGIKVHYARADITDLGQLRAGLAELVDRTGPITALLHGAGRNEPSLIGGIDMAAFRRILSPKVDGFRTVLSAVDTAKLKLVVTFGSIIGRAGLRGEAHYATANEWLADLTAEFAASHPHCHTLCLEWSVWSGVGMGERLAVVESLARDGITPITPDFGAEVVGRLVLDPDAEPVQVIMGRVGKAQTVALERSPLPLLRFVDRALLRYHGVEMVSEVELNTGTDPYLLDHALAGDLLFPAVMGMEAMTQVAVAAFGADRDTRPLIEDAEFLRAIVVPHNGTTTIRIAATVVDSTADGAGVVEVAIRTAETDFAIDHFRAKVVFGAEGVLDGTPHWRDDADDLPVDLDPASLYADMLFQGERFQRLHAYYRVSARHVDAEVETRWDMGWFAPFLPRDLLLGDPGMRDALMHGNQVCVPHATLLPLGVDRIHPYTELPEGSALVRFCATERSHDGDTYVYDVVVRTPDGTIVERWEGLRLRAVRKQGGRQQWHPALLGPYVERRIGELLATTAAVGVIPDTAGALRRANTRSSVRGLLGRDIEIHYRPDGRPELDSGQRLAVSHAAGVTMCVVDDATTGCDLEVVTKRPAEQWRGLLGAHAALLSPVMAQAGGSIDEAGTRIWSAVESLRKAGLPIRTPLTLLSATVDSWTVFGCGRGRVATLLTGLAGLPDPVVVAVYAEGGA